MHAVLEKLDSMHTWNNLSDLFLAFIIRTVEKETGNVEMDA